MNLLRKIPTILGAGGGSLLPPELQACEWLKSDGNAYIQTSFNANLITSLECKCNLNGGYQMFGCGAATNSTHRRFGLSTYNNTYFIWSWNKGNERTISTVDGADLLVLKVEKGDKKAYFNSETVNFAGTVTNINTYQNLAIFAGNYLEGLLINQTYAPLYYIKSNLFELYTCYIKSGQTYTDNKGNTCPAGTCGMYDIVNNVFYTNDGTGNFTHGGDINI